MEISYLAWSNAHPLAPSAAEMRPQLGSPPASAHCHKGDSVIALAAFTASALSRAPLHGQSSTSSHLHRRVPSPVPGIVSRSVAPGEISPPLDVQHRLVYYLPAHLQRGYTCR